MWFVLAFLSKGLFGSSDGANTVIMFVTAVVAGIVYYRAYKDDGVKYSAAMDIWSKQWVCMRCGHLAEGPSFGYGKPLEQQSLSGPWTGSAQADA